MRLFQAAALRKVVGCAMADHMRTFLACEAIDMAARRCPIEKGATIFPLRPGRPVHVAEVPGPHQGLRNSALGGAHGGVTGWVRGRSRSTPR